MHILLRERHGLEETAAAEDLGQAPADLVVLSFADSDLGAFAAAWRGGRETLPSLRLANLRRLAHPLSVDLYLQNTLSGARGILIRLLGGIDYWRYGVEQVSALAAAKGIALAIIPGDGRPDPALDAASNLPPSTLRRLKTLCDNGGTDSARAALAQLALAAGMPAVPPVARAALPRHGFYRPGSGVVEPSEFDLAPDGAPIVLVVFYRAILAASDTAPIDRLMAELARQGMRPIGLFATSLKDRESDGWLRQWIAAIAPDAIVNATAFSARGDNGAGSPLEIVDAPVLQVALAGSSRELWEKSDRGLSPSDLAIHVVLPELDGRLFAGVASFKQIEAADPELGYARTVHAADDGRIAAIVARARAWIALRRTAQADKRLAIVLSAYPGRDDQMAHAVGLDAPESAVEMLHVLRDRGYAVSDTPADGAALIDRLKRETIRWPVESYKAALAGLDPALTSDLEAQWGAPESDPAIVGGDFVFKAVRCGHALIALQPDRGRRADRAAEYHDPRRAPRHAYVAFYLWLREVEQMPRDDPYRRAWHAGMAAGKIGRAVAGVLARRAAGCNAGDLPVHRQQSRRGRDRQAQARRRHHRTHHAADLDRNIAAGIAHHRAVARRIFRGRRSRSAAARAARQRDRRCGARERPRPRQRPQRNHDAAASHRTARQFCL